MSDVASLIIRVTTNGVDSATADLGKLGQAAVNAGAAIGGLETARISTVMMVLLRELVPVEGNLRGIDDDDIVAAIKGRRECGLVLAAQDRRDVGGKAAKDDTVGVDDIPLLVNVLLFEGKGLHVLLFEVIHKFARVLTTRYSHER